VSERHIAEETETAFDLSKKACNNLFKEHDKNEIDGIIFCTQSPDYIMPSNSFLLHNYLGLKDEVFAFDFNHACTGYIYALSMAHSFITAGLARQVLLVNADTYSKYINKNDRSTRVLFGDAAACTIVEGSSNSRGIIDIALASSGKDYDKFWIQAGGMRMPRSAQTAAEVSDESGNIRCQENITMSGLEVWSFINSVVPKQISNLLSRNSVQPDEIDLFVFHQASQMTLDSIIRKLELDREKVFINIQDVGNTVSASIPIALKDAMRMGRVVHGNRIVLSGFGVGLSYGSILMNL